MSLPRLVTHSPPWPWAMLTGSLPTGIPAWATVAFPADVVAVVVAVSSEPPALSPPPLAMITTTATIAARIPAPAAITAQRLATAGRGASAVGSPLASKVGSAAASTGAAAPTATLRSATCVGSPARAAETARAKSPADG